MKGKRGPKSVFPKKNGNLVAQIFTFRLPDQLLGANRLPSLQPALNLLS